MTIKLDISITFWIPSLIDDTVLHFSSIILIEKVISLSENLSISSTTAKMFLINSTFQTLLLLNPMSILVWFLAVNTTTPAQILPKTLLRFNEHWNFNKISVKPQQDFCCFNEKPPSTRSCSDQSCLHLALPYLTLPHLTPLYLVTYSIFKPLIMPHHVKMCLVLWQLTIQYDYLTHFNQLLFSFPISSHLIQSLSYPALFHHCLIWFYNFTGAQPSKKKATVMMSNHMLRNLIKILI